MVENALYRVEFSNRGAVVKSWQLKNYKDDSKPQKTLDLVHQQAAAETGGTPLGQVLRMRTKTLLFTDIPFSK